MKREARLLLLLLAALSPGSGALAGPITREQTPEPLRPWIDWVLYGHEEARCPFFQGAEDRRQCLWPSRLALDLGDGGGRFTQGWLAYKDAWAPLPGDGRYWPQEVRLDGRPAAVTLQQGVPSVRLSRGRHTVSGAFVWDGLPSLLQVPTETGLLDLSVRGRAVPFPGRDEQGRLWLQKRAGEGEGESRIEIAVHRRVADDIPLVLTTRIELHVSGRSREALLGRALPDGFVPMSLQGPLPARLERDGRLRVQVRPGRWTLELAARHEAPVAALAAPDPGGPWDADEVWVFDARPHLRLVAVEGAPAIDPQQTTLPDDWKSLPAYLMRPGQTMSLVEKRRGDSDPAPDRLDLSRTLWLDFDGGGFTIHDQITGSMERGWRLEMPAPASLGRVAVNGQEQFITRRADGGPAGVEIRQGQVRLEADSRVPRSVSGLSAVGWDHDFSRVSGELRLPPGWRLLHASGLDDVSSTWISDWTLLDLFLLLIAALAVGNLWGRRWGALALVALVLTWIETGAPRWTWLAVLAGEALSRALPAGRLARAVRLLHRLALVALILVAAPFLVRQVRAALYPALEQPRASMAGRGGIGGFVRIAPQQEFETAGVVRGTEEALEEKARSMGDATRGAFQTMPSAPPARKKAIELSYLNAPDPGTVVQTGPGLPGWTWRTISLGWRGPVQDGQRLRFVLLPPGLNFALAILRVALLTLLAICLLGVSGADWIRPLMGRIGLSGAARAALIALVLGGAAAGQARADLPSNDLLDALRNRLLAPPDCRPNCASSPRLALEIGPARLQARMEVHAAAETAVPLPGALDQWAPRLVLLDGAPAAGLVRTPDGRSGCRWPPAATRS